MIFHPCLNEQGIPQPIHHPHHPSPLAAWARADQLATTVPRALMPEQINGIEIAPWSSVPCNPMEWEAEAAGMPFTEPPFTLPAGISKAAAGAVIREADGRVWLVSPTNGFGGYRNTFAKGTQEPGISLRATALKEAYEEAGLRISLSAFLVDVLRTTSYCRFYLARRVGGNPADMGWESQAVHLAPRGELAAFAGHPMDEPVLQALQLCEGYVPAW